MVAVVSWCWILACSATSFASGYPVYASKIPNANSVRRNGQSWPGVGHTQSSGGPSPKNQFGRDFASAGYTWSPALCRMDSDGDNQTNGVELGDPDCTWSEGATPLRVFDISHPGYADSVTSWVRGQPAPTPAPTPTPAPGPAPTPAPPAAASVATVTDLRLGGSEGIHLSFRASGTDSAEITARLDRTAWIGVGISHGSAQSMSGNGDGSDIVACSDGQVRRYWVTSTSMDLNDYTAVAGATCTQANGVTTMTFTRKIAAENARQRALTPGTLQQVIFAHGADGGTSIAYHGREKGSKMVDFGSGTVRESDGLKGQRVLSLHLACMGLAWAGLFPFGAVAANRLRSVPDAREGAWFRLHRRFQIVGWLLQLIGFGAAVWYCQIRTNHFRSAHTYLGVVLVVFCTLQPLNALLRPHVAAEGEQKTLARHAWEVLHKGGGWLAVLLGIVNVILGILIVSEPPHSKLLMRIAAGIAAAAFLPVVIFFVLAVVNPSNALSRWLVGSDKAASQDP